MEILKALYQKVMALFRGKASAPAPPDAFVGLPYVFAVAGMPRGAVVTARASMGKTTALCEVTEATRLCEWGVSFTPTAPGKWALAVTLQNGAIRETVRQTVNVAAEVPRALLPEMDADERMGVCVHAGYIQGMDWFPVRGVAGWVRVDGAWASCERTPGLYDWTYLDNLVNPARAEGMKPLIILDYGNPLYCTTYTTPPDVAHPSSESMRAWLRWCDAVVSRYGTDALYEIWNEWGCKYTDPSGYAALVKATIGLLKARHPEAILCGGSLAFFHFGNTDGKLKTVVDRLDAAGGCACLDYLSIHPYTKTWPEDIGAWLGEGWTPPRPFVATEAGWSLDQWGYGGRPAPISEREQAWLNVRSTLEALRRGWPLAVHFTWRDHHPEGGEYGCLDDAGTERPLRKALAELHDRLVGCWYAGYGETPDRARVLYFPCESGEVQVAFALKDGVAPEWTPPADALLFSMMGERVENTGVVVLGPEPVYAVRPNGGHTI